MWFLTYGDLVTGHKNLSFDNNLTFPFKTFDIVIFWLISQIQDNGQLIYDVSCAPTCLILPSRVAHRHNRKRCSTFIIVIFLAKKVVFSVYDCMPYRKMVYKQMQNKRKTNIVFEFLTIE